MRDINVSEVTSTIAKLCMDSCYYLPEAVKAKIRAAAETEDEKRKESILDYAQSVISELGLSATQKLFLYPVTL